MDRPAGDRARIAAALQRVPDDPRWVDTRGMLLSGRAIVRAPDDADLRRDGFLVIAADVSLVGVVGAPAGADVRAVVGSLAGDVNLLAQSEDAAAIARALPSWTRQTAILHVLPRETAWAHAEEPGARIFTRETAPSLDHVPEPLRIELLDALRGRTTSRFVHGELPHAVRPAGARLPMAAVWADRLPVAFCYPVWQTERYWDVAIDTIDGYRNRGYGARAARAMIRHMWQSGRSPVWGALETNRASRALADRLGFIETAGVAVFTAA
jgi:hypothetical protein